VRNRQTRIGPKKRQVRKRPPPRQLPMRPRPLSLRLFTARWYSTDSYFTVFLTNRGWAVAQRTLREAPMGNLTKIIGVHRTLSGALKGATRRNRALHLLERQPPPHLVLEDDRKRARRAQFTREFGTSGQLRGLRPSRSANVSQERSTDLSGTGINVQKPIEEL
jgi:hypothetical protein